ncbi:hypothetical protein [Frankia gtarii]|uniref:hypothetical protein n=1 Tax=Frankia gtarii TaxID=2950102 RepID=UPI0021BE21EB|nr:hypothetical protein [Frankia gtarii]
MAARPDGSLGSPGVLPGQLAGQPPGAVQILLRAHAGPGRHRNGGTRVTEGNTRSARPTPQHWGS